MANCAQCGAPDTADYMWDEGDTFYCSRCAFRTETSTGGLATRVCQECGQLADRKAAYCRWCNCWNPDSP